MNRTTPYGLAFLALAVGSVVYLNAVGSGPGKRGPSRSRP